MEKGFKFMSLLFKTITVLSILGSIALIVITDYLTKDKK
jgi:hypothetical protein